jgi:hypothetical protein
MFLLIKHNSPFSQRGPRNRDIPSTPFFSFYQTWLQVKCGLIHSPVSPLKYKRPRRKWSPFDNLEIGRLHKWRQPLVDLLKHSSNAPPILCIYSLECKLSDDNYPNKQFMIII